MKKGAIRFLKIFSLSLGFLILLLFIIFYILLNKSYNTVKSLKVVDNPTQFTVNFISEKETPIILEDCRRFMDLYGWCVRSQYFPFKKLSITNVVREGVKIVYKDNTKTNLSTEGRWILNDSILGIFYVYTKGNYYGPFRSQ